MTRFLRHIVALEKEVGAFAPRGLFAPQDFFMSGEVNQTLLDVEALQSLACRMACFINMPFFKITVVAAKQKDSVAGHIEGSDSQNVYIEIEPEFLQYPVAAIKVLAHEISHKYLAFHRLSLAKTHDDEIRTDIAAIYLGFGAYALNGGTYRVTYKQDFETTVRRTVKNGYLDLDESAFVYDIVCRMRGFDESAIFAGLNKDAAECVRRVRKQYAASYPPDNLDVSPLKDRIGCVREKLESSDLELCNIEKIKILFPGALAAKSSDVDAVRRDVVKTRCALRKLEMEVAASAGRVTYLSIPVWAEDVRELVNMSDAHLAFVQLLNESISQRVPLSVTRADWDALTSVVIECPKCTSRMRLPPGKSHIGVTCPKCKYAFDYSTTCPEFKWVSPQPLKNEHQLRGGIFDRIKSAARRRRRSRLRPVKDQVATTRYICPHCGKETDKVLHRSHTRLIFLVWYLKWQTTSCVLCSSCAQRDMFRKIPMDIVCANFLWPFSFSFWEFPQLFFSIVNDYARDRNWEACEKQDWEAKCMLMARVFLSPLLFVAIYGLIIFMLGCL